MFYRQFKQKYHHLHHWGIFWCQTKILDHWKRLHLLRALKQILSTLNLELEYFVSSKLWSDHYSSLVYLSQVWELMNSWLTQNHRRKFWYLWLLLHQLRMHLHYYPWYGIMRLFYHPSQHYSSRYEQCYRLSKDRPKIRQLDLKIRVLQDLVKALIQEFLWQRIWIH